MCLSIYVYLCLCVCFSFWVCVSARSAVSVCLCGLQSSWPTWDWAASLIWTQLATWASPPHESTSYVTDTDHWPLHFSYLNLRYSPQIIQNLNFHHPLHWIGPPQMSLHRVPTVKKKNIYGLLANHQSGQALGFNTQMTWRADKSEDHPMFSSHFFLHSGPRVLGTFSIFLFPPVPSHLTSQSSYRLLHHPPTQTHLSHT